MIKNALSGFGRHSKGSGILSPGILLVCVGLNGEIQTARIDATKAYHVLQPAAASEDVGVSPAFFDITAVVELSIFLRPGTGEEAMQTTMPTFVTSVELGQKTSSKQSLGSTLCVHRVRQVRCFLRPVFATGVHFLRSPGIPLPLFFLPLLHVLHASHGLGTGESSFLARLSAGCHSIPTKYPSLPLEVTWSH